MNKNKLLSIGQLSKQTGVNIGSLRYYDQLGILPPTYVDEQSGYRYYSFPQIYVVEAIQFCVELDLPLKEFPMFAQNGAGKINFSNLIEQGRILAKEKIRTTKKKLQLLKRLQSEIEHAERCFSSTTPIPYQMPRKLCWTIPYPQALSQDKRNVLYGKMMLDLNRHKISAGYEIGLLAFWAKGEFEQFLYIEIADDSKNIKQFENIIKLPSAQYLCIQSEENHMEFAMKHFSDLLKKENNNVVFVRELFSNENDFFKPIFEICCSIKE